MNKKYTIISSLLIVIYIVYHLISLIYSPLPWGDETCFASIAQSYIKNGDFYDKASIIGMHEPMLMYGPVYFAIQSSITKMFGFSLFTFRFVNLFFGFVDLFLLYRVGRLLQFTSETIIFMLLIIGLDPTFNQDIHSGRMEYVALFFFLSSYLIFARIVGRAGFKTIAYSALTGILIGCAMLTTPRIIFSLAFYACFFLYEILSREKRDIKMIVIKYGIMLLFFVSIYMVWVISAFGGINGYIKFYTSSKLLMHHIGAGGENFKLNYHSFFNIYALLCVIILVLKKEVRQNRQLLLLTVPVIIAYILLVNGVSNTYYAFVIPFISLLVIGVTINVLNNKSLKYINGAIICLFLLAFVFKGIYVFASINQRDPAYYDKEISGYITKNSAVAGDFQYYYIGIENNCSYQFLEEESTTREEKIAYFSTHRYDYFIINRNSADKAFYDSALLDKKYKLIATVENNNSNHFMSRVINKLPFRINDTYACYIYKRIE